MSEFDSLADELRAHICSFHRHPDLTVEFHSPGYHEHYRYSSDVDITPHKDRNYCFESDPGDEYYSSVHAAERVSSFMKLFEDSDEWKGLPRARCEALAQHVRFLCLDFDFDETLVDPLGIFACFQNLGHLELVMKWPSGEIWDTAVQIFLENSRAPLNNLRTLRLHLELAVLDRPIGCDNPPPEGDSDAEDFANEDCIAPRALAALLGVVDLAKQFPCLTRLSLCRPTESKNIGVHDDFVSIGSDIAILEEWAALLRATRGTLEQLVLDQRPFAEDIERDSSTHKEYLIHYAYGPGYDRFVEHTLPALLEDGADAKWPCLKSVQLHGFDVPPQHGLNVHKPQRLLAVLGPRFEPLGVDVRSNLGRWMRYDYGDGIIQHGDGLGGSPLEDDE
ncbi:hypothetical protein C8R45DRAFT_1211280 [Mycena sanguinolenta]|nr:hypothetical protein C8R45DRAFT_1211280 [Mycena sanguinolenta]